MVRQLRSRKFLAVHGYLGRVNFRSADGANRQTCDLEITHQFAGIRVFLEILEGEQEQVESIRAVEQQIIDVTTGSNPCHFVQANNYTILLGLK